MARNRTHQQRKRAKALRFQQERALANDLHWIEGRTQRGFTDIPSKHSVKNGRKECKFQREMTRFKPGFKGPIAATGKEQSHKTGYTPAIRAKDGTTYVSMKAWIRKGV